MTTRWLDVKVGGEVSKLRVVLTAAKGGGYDYVARDFNNNPVAQGWSAGRMSDALDSVKDSAAQFYDRQKFEAAEKERKDPMLNERVRNVVHLATQFDEALVNADELVEQFVLDSERQAELHELVEELRDMAETARLHTVVELRKRGGA